MSSDLFEPLLSHVQSFTPHQKAHIPKAILAVLEKDYLEEQRIAKEAAEKALEEERLYKEKLEAERVKQHKLAEERKTKEEAVNQSITGDTPTPTPAQTVMSIGVIGVPSPMLSPVTTVPIVTAEPTGTIPVVESVLSHENPDSEPVPLKSTPDVSNEQVGQSKPHESVMASSDKEESLAKNDIRKDIMASEKKMDSRSGKSMDSMNAPQKLLGDLDVENGNNEDILSRDVPEKDFVDSIETDQESLSLVEKETKNPNDELEAAVMGVSMGGSEEVDETLLDTTASESQSDVEATTPAKIKLEKERNIDTQYDNIEHVKVEIMDKDGLHDEQMEAGKEVKQELHDTEKEFETLRAELIERKTQYSEDYSILRKEFEEYRQCSEMQRECQFEEELNKGEIELEVKYAALVRKLEERGEMNKKSVCQDMEEIKQAWTNQKSNLLNMNQQMSLAASVEGQKSGHSSMPEKGHTHTSEEEKGDQLASEEGKDDQHVMEDKIEILEREPLSISGDSGPNVAEEDLSNKEEHVDLSPSKRVGTILARSAGKRKQTVAAPTRKSLRTKKTKY